MSTLPWWLNNTTRGSTLLNLPNELISKFALWTSIDNEKAGYYVNQIGAQEREIITQNGVAGVIHPGRAIKYDSSKNQYSRTGSVQPSNFRLINNSLTFYFKIKLDTIPSGSASWVFGNEGYAASGSCYAQVENTSGYLKLYLVHSSGTIVISSDINICDGLWHKIFILVDKTGNAGMYVDNILRSGFTNISALVFGDINQRWCLGSYSSGFSGVKYIRDFRIYSSAVTSDTDRNSLHRDEYVTGVTSWYFCEEGKENTTTNKLKDSIGTNNLTNYLFDSASLASGPWSSLLNKFGYSNYDYQSEDLITGEGNFSTPSNWAFSAAKFTVANGVGWFKAVDAVSPYAYCQIVSSYGSSDLLKISFNITEGPATLYFTDQTVSAINAQATYAVGSHTITFNPLRNSCTKVGIYGIYSGGPFKIDNLVVTKLYESGIQCPKMDGAIPTTDTSNRVLVFYGQAKYNLQKVNESTINLPDYCGELFDACSLITENDWYDNLGVGNEIALENINPYQTGRCYYKNETLIIIKADQDLTIAEDTLIKRYLSLNSPYIYSINVALGSKTGTTSQIYATPQAILNSVTASTFQSFTPVSSDLDPIKKYIALGWDDFFVSDQLYTVPLNAKYGFSNTFYKQIVPNSNNYLKTKKYPAGLTKTIEQSGSYIGDHAFEHISYLLTHPLADGRNTPSKDDLRLARSDGTNELGHNINLSIDASGSGMDVVRESWLRLSDTIGSTLWKDLSDEDCLAFTKSLGIFGMPIEGQNGEKVLEALDYLSERYCGTTGYSVLNGDYTVRLPNTLGGVEPDSSHRILGGIFTGSSTTQNHEIWERTLTIIKEYNKEFEGKFKPMLSYAYPGGNIPSLHYNVVNPPDPYGRYNDRYHTKLATGATKYNSSILGLNRSFIEVLQGKGYILTNAGQGEAYASYSFDHLNQLEAQRLFKKNGLKKPDNVGDGYMQSKRCWDATIPVGDINNLLTSSDLVEDLYDYTFSNARYSGLTELSMPAPFDRVLNGIAKYTAWGITPEFIGDTSNTGNASYILVLEALYQFCLRAGISVISHEEACLMGMNKTLPSGYNYFPNHSFSTTVKTITNSSNAILYPDGWNGGIVVSENTGEGVTNVLYKNTNGTVFTRQYAIKPSILNLSFKAMGIGTLKIRKILNKDTYNTTSGESFVEINSISINSTSSYSEYTAQISIPDMPLEIYTTPATLGEEAYQSYMKGYGNKICGIQIELIVTTGNYIKIGNCSLVE